MWTMKVSPSHSVASSTRTHRAFGHEAGRRQPAAQAPPGPAVGLVVGPGADDAATELAIGHVEPLGVPVGVGGEHDSPWAHDARGLSQCGNGVGDVLEHLHETGRVV